MSDEETLRRDKLLLDLMIHAYDEDVARNELVDTKNSQMIVFTGSMLTLHATLFGNLLVNSILMNELICVEWKMILSLFMLTSLCMYVFSLFVFINAYAFNKKFCSSPHPEELVDKAINNVDIEKVQGNILCDFNKVIGYNSTIIEDKVNKGKCGFGILKIAGISTLLFLLLLFTCLFLS